MKTVFLFVALLLICLSCKRINEGIISKKSYVPPHDSYWTTYIPMGKVFMPIVHHDYISDTTYYITFFNIINSDTFGEILVSSDYFWESNVGEHIKLKDEKNDN